MHRQQQAQLAPVVKDPQRSSLRLVPTRLHDVRWTYSAMLMDRGSPLQSPPKGVTAQSAGILVVDDEPIVRIVIGRILTSRGYLVLPATNGAEALDFFNFA